MGTVWLARDELLGREVALKEVLPQPGATAAQADEQRQRSLREGRIAARLTHPHVIAMYDVALDGGDPWLVMEYLPSRSLAAVLKSSGPLPAAEVRRIGAQLSDALAAAHRVGIVHRDVKPGNVLLAEAERGPRTVKITDFGISHAYGDVTLTQTGILHGTPAYLAPEVARGSNPTEASDVFSLGATLYTAVEGVPPFGFDDNSIALLHRVARGEIAPPEQAGAMTPTLLRMLEPNPEHRLTMNQVRDALSGADAGEHHSYPPTMAYRRAAAVSDATEDTRSRPWSSPPRAGQRRAPVAVWIAAAVVGVLLLAATAVGIIAVTRNGSGAGGQATALPPPSSSTPTATVTTEPTTTSPSVTTTTTAPALTGASAAAAVQDYYAVLPAELATAWNRLGPTLKAQGFDAYAAFWSSFQRVTAKNASSDDGGSTVRVTVVFDRGRGSTTTENHLLTMLPSASGPLIDSDTLLSSRTGN